MHILYLFGFSMKESTTCLFLWGFKPRKKRQVFFVEIQFSTISYILLCVPNKFLLFFKCSHVPSFQALLRIRRERFSVVCFLFHTFFFPLSFLLYFLLFFLFFLGIRLTLIRFVSCMAFPIILEWSITSHWFPLWTLPTLWGNVEGKKGTKLKLKYKNKSTLLGW